MYWKYKIPNQAYWKKNGLGKYQNDKKDIKTKDKYLPNRILIETETISYRIIINNKVGWQDLQWNYVTNSKTTRTWV